MNEQSSKYPHVLRAVAETPWAIYPPTLAVILEILALRAEGERLSEDEIRERLGPAGPGVRQAQTTGTVAVLPLFGVIIPRANLMSDMSGGTSLQRFSESFRAALNDPQIGSILLDVDSPGGSTDLVPETAAMIREARGQKPIVAIADTMAASAAYYIAAQADELVATPSGMVGSIGVVAAHDDISGMQEKAGIKTTLITAGRFKAETSPFAPLSDDARAAIQERVDVFYDMFVRDVALGRGVPERVVREGFGQGRIVTAENALAQRMVDRVEDFETTVERMTATSPKRSGQDALGGIATIATSVTANQSSTVLTGGLSFADEAEAARVAASALVNRVRSLAELQRGRLTAAKREQLIAVADALSGAGATLAELLASTDPEKAKHADAALRERARFESRRTHI